MRWVLSLLLLYIGHLPAQELPPLHFAIADSWTMPLVDIENSQPVAGIMFELMSTVAKRTERRAQFHVMPRLRIEKAMERGSIDVRCFVMPSWTTEQSSNFSWSPPLFLQRDLLVAHDRPAEATHPSALPRQVIGTVLGFHYPTLQAQFTSGHFVRDDARNQLQVLQKLQAGRYRYAVSSQTSLDWFNRSLPSEQRLQALSVLEEQQLSCMVRNDPSVPTQDVLRTLVRMKDSGDIARIFARYSPPASTPTEE